MGRKKKLELTRMIVSSGPPRWRKVYRGRIFYFRGESPEALKQWRELRATLADTPTAEELTIWREHQPPPPTTFDEIVVATGGPLTYEERRALLPTRIRMVVEKVDRWRQRQQGKTTSKTTSTADKGDTIKSAVARFVATTKNRIGNSITADRWDTLRRSLARFVSFSGDDGTNGRKWTAACRLSRPPVGTGQAREKPRLCPPVAVVRQAVGVMVLRHGTDGQVAP